MTQANIAMLAARRKSLGQKKKTKTKHAEGRRTSNFLELPDGFRLFIFIIINIKIIQFNTTATPE